jgi:hypothetical protein
VVWAVTRTQQEVNVKYHMKARESGLEQGVASDDTGPFLKEPNKYGQKGRVIASAIGAFAEVSPDTNAIADFASSVLTNEHCLFLVEKLFGSHVNVKPVALPATLPAWQCISAWPIS